MSTVVTLEVVGGDAPAQLAATQRVEAWFAEINDRCTRFDPQSELTQLTLQIGIPISVSPLLFEALRFALAVANETEGAFDPTVGHRMEALGFNRNWQTGTVIASSMTNKGMVNYRDIELDEVQHTVTLHKQMVLDLSAVAKGLAVDLAARELEPFTNFAIDAGGDLYLGGQNADGGAWSVGIRNPRDPAELIASVKVTNGAVCTSGNYERRSTTGESHHILDPRTGASARSLASVTVLAPSAMVADALATATFVLGVERGAAFLESQGVQGLLITPELERITTRGLALE